MPLSIGEQIGQYTIEARIGTGGMATVYKAYHARLDRFVAIKVMHPTFLSDPNFHHRFEREARIIARLDHPNIVSIYDFDEYEGQPYLVMKYIEGHTLKRLMQRDDALSLQEGQYILQTLANALTYAHDMDILHRDIKPSNIIIDARGEPYLMDFGLARIAQGGESTMSADMMLGTPQYISPEQAQGKIDLTPRTDVYSLGIILYELTVGQVPFSGDTAYAIVHDHIYSPLPKPRDLNPSISPQVETVLLKALAKNPDDRYPTPTAMMEDFLRAEDGQKIKANPSPRITPYTPPQPPKPKRTHVSTPKGKRSTDFSWLPPMPPLIAKPEDTRNFEQRMEDYGKQMEQWGRNLEDRFDNNSNDHFKHERNIGTIHWRPNTKWRKDAYGNQGFFTDAELDLQYERMSEEDRLRLHIEKRIKCRQEVIGHIIAYVLVNIMLWVIYGLTGGGHPWPIYPMMGWGIAVFFHAMSYYTQYGRGYDHHETQVQRELDEEYERRDTPHKPKNRQSDYIGGQVRLTQDGEFTESFVDELDQYYDDDNQYEKR